MTDFKKEPSNDSNIIGYCMSEKKSQKLNWTEFAPVCRKHGFSLVKIDLNKPMESQGPFTVILHKLTDVFNQTMQGNTKAMAMVDNLESYIANHPEVAIIDPLNSVRKLLDRYVTYRVIQDSNLEHIDVFTPPFVELTSDDIRTNSLRLECAGVKYPFVCKPTVAQGTSDCHKMTVIFNEAGLADCKPLCVAQTFINHNAVLYKLFVLGEGYWVVERPSLKNFYPSDRASIFFDSHDVSKPDSVSSLSILDPDDLTDCTKSVKADPVKLFAITKTVRERLNMDLLSIDVVVDNVTGRHAVIDINAYPGYEGYPNFFESLMECIQKRITEHKATRLRAIRTPSVKEEKTRVDHDDSGFDTSDSSDEKKREQKLRCTISSGGRTSTNQVMSKKHVERQH